MADLNTPKAVNRAEREWREAQLPVRQTARGLLTDAKQYHNAAALIAEHVGTDGLTGGLAGTSYDSPFYFLCGHSLELSMKAALLAKGVTHDELKKKVGHDLLACLDRVADRRHQDATICNEHRGLIELLNGSYQAKDFEYRFAGSKRWPAVAPLLHVVKEFCLYAERILSE